MKEEIQNLIAEVENKKSKAEREAKRCVEEGNNPLSAMHVGEVLAFDFCIERLINILKSNGVT